MTSGTASESAVLGIIRLFLLKSVMIRFYIAQGVKSASKTIQKPTKTDKVNILMNDMNINFNNMKYKITCADVKGLPATDLPEIVISGRSNAGKSSLVNALASSNKLARVSSKPGKTREIIYFDLDGKALVADLPGYGYSAASKEVTAKFSDLCDNYFRCGRKISLVLFLMDIRRTPSEEDIGMLEYLNNAGIPYIMVLTKCDKFSNAEIRKQLETLSEFFDFDSEAQVFAVSSKDKKGISDLKTAISDIICNNR